MPPDVGSQILEAVSNVGKKVDATSTRVADLSTKVEVLSTKFEAHTISDSLFNVETCKPARTQVATNKEAIGKLASRALGWTDVLKLAVAIGGMLVMLKKLSLI